MKRTSCRRAERGVTLIVALVMLVVVTLMVTSAHMLSTTNLKAVANVQFRDQAVAAANVAIEEVVSDLFIAGLTTAPSGGDLNVDLDNDTVTDYTVVVSPPTCLRADPELPIGTPPGSGSSVTIVLPPEPPVSYSTVWDVRASVNDAATGTAVVVRQGVRVRLTHEQKVAACP